VELDPDYTARLLTGAHHAFGTDARDLLLCALGLAVRDWRGVRRFLVDVEGHGRESLFDGVDVSRTVGWFTAIFPFLLDAGSADGLDEAIVRMKDGLRRVPGKGIGYGILERLSRAAKEEGSPLAFSVKPEVLFNYLGRFDEADGSVFAVSDLPRGRETGAGIAKRHALEINAMVAGGRLSAEFVYRPDLFRRKSVEELADLVRKRLELIINHCCGKETRSATPTDFHYKGLNREDLDNILGLLEER
jgi:non-ribosomal peptide synthase protein (TIGR01720 family)